MLPLDETTDRSPLLSCKDDVDGDLGRLPSLEDSAASPIEEVVVAVDITAIVHS